MSTERQFQLIAGNLCLDFTNTLDNRGDPQRAEELLTDYADLLAFLRQSSALAEPLARRLAARSARDRSAASKVLDGARRLREALQRIFMAVLHGRVPYPADLDGMNAAWTRVFRHLRFLPGVNGFEWQWTSASDAEPALDWVLWPILRSAVALLTSPDLERVRACEAETCEWLFLDTSRNRSRRWCDMKQCGNRSKVRRFYQRHHASERRSRR